METLQQFYSVKELSQFALNCLPTTDRRILDKAKRENWVSRKRAGRGGGLEYALTSLPEDVQTEIRTRFALQVVENKPKALPAKVMVDLKQASQRQIEIADARAALAQYVLSLEQGQKRARTRIIQQVIDQIKLGTLPEAMLAMVKVANARSGGQVQLSERSLKQWVLDYEKAGNSVERLQALVPSEQGRKALDLAEIAWLHDFLGFYQTFTGVTVSHAYKRFARAYGENAPSLGQVQRALKKLPQAVLQRGRLTGVAYKQLLPYVARDWSVFKFGEMYVGDGHGFKAKIRHPDTGAPFQPEVTAMIDARSHLVVGWSVHKSESVIAVADALRHAISQHGLPIMYYSDNGRGEKNRTFDADITGLLPRLGIHHETGIAGNAQGRGIIERLWKTTLIPLAREYETFTGKTVDKSSAHLIHRKIESAAKALDKNKPMNAEQQRYYSKLPTFEQFLADVERCFTEYNHAVHSALPKLNGERPSPEQYREWLLENEDTEQRMLEPLELDLLYRPEEIRTTSRGLVEFRTNKYFSLALADYHGEKVRVAYDIHDASYVIVKTLDGKWICRAEFEGNKRAAFPENVVEQSRRKSVEAANKRLADKQLRNNRELNPVITIEQQPDFSLLKPAKPKPEEAPVFLTKAEKQDWERKHGVAVGS